MSEDNGQGPPQPLDPRDGRITELEGEVAQLRIKIARDTPVALEEAVDQLRTQLAGVSVVALGGTSEPVIARRGDWGWSVAYDDVLKLRRKLDAAITELRATRVCLHLERQVNTITETRTLMEEDFASDLELRTLEDLRTQVVRIAINAERLRLATSDDLERLMDPRPEAPSDGPKDPAGEA